MAATTLTHLLETGPPLHEDAWSLGRPALESVLAEVDAGRHDVVECGSGLSTILIARRLRELGAGRVHSLEHDPASPRRAGASSSANRSPTAPR